MSYEDKNRATGRTTGMLLVALGKAVSHPPKGYVIFEDHYPNPDPTWYRDCAIRLREMATALDLREIEIYALTQGVLIRCLYKQERETWVPPAHIGKGVKV